MMVEIGLRPLQPEIVIDEGESLEYSRKYDPWPFHIDGNDRRAKLI